MCVGRTDSFATKTAGAPRRNTASYQQLVNAPGCSSPDEWLASIGDVYGHAAVIGANLDPISGDAPGRTCLRRGDLPAPQLVLRLLARSKPTSGCVSLAEDDLEFALRLIDPSLGVQFAIGELSWLRASALMHHSACLKSAG